MLISGIFISKKFGKIKTRKSNQYLIGRRNFINLVTTQKKKFQRKETKVHLIHYH